MLSPSWTKPTTWSTGRDPLGMQATSVRLYRQLAPGLTNVTNRLRYFSFYCWVVAAYETSRHSTDAKKWQIFIRRAEAIYALAAHLVDAPQSLGMAGGDWAMREKPALQSEGTSIDLTPHTDNPGVGGQYLKARRGNMGQFYVASMLEAGMLKRGDPVPLLDEGFGWDLARSFASSIGSSADALLAGIEVGTIDRAALLEIGRDAHPASLPIESEEWSLLSSYMLGERLQFDQGARSRRSSAWLRLELLHRGIGTRDEQPLRRAFYARKAPDQSAITITGATIDGWRAYQANEYGHVALECVLNGIVSLLPDFGGGAAPATLIAALLERALESDVLSQSWASWANSLSENDEDDLAGPILRVIAQGGSGDGKTWQAALKLLAVLWVRWGDNQLGVRDEIARGAGPTGRSLAGVLHALNAASNGDVAGVLRSVLQRYIVAEHMTIAGQKLAGSGTFTYHFLLADGEMSDGQLGKYTYTTPRLQNLTRFMGDAGLHAADKVTAEGRRFLDAYQAH